MPLWAVSSHMYVLILTVFLLTEVCPLVCLLFQMQEPNNEVLEMTRQQMKIKLKKKIEFQSKK